MAGALDAMPAASPEPRCSARCSGSAGRRALARRSPRSKASRFNSATAGRGATLSAAYCIGLGVPFVLVAVGMRAGLGALAVVRRHTARGDGHRRACCSIATGLLEVTGEWNHLVIQLRAHLPGFSETPL